MHFRAPPDVRGSGKERGHGTELKYCPKCGKELKPGKHHVGCSAGKSAPRQAAKRQRQISSTTESEWVTQSSPSNSQDFEDFDEEETLDRSRGNSLEMAMRRRVSRSRRQAAMKGALHGTSRECKLESHLNQQSKSYDLDTGAENGDLVFTNSRAVPTTFPSSSEAMPVLESLDTEGLPEEYRKEHFLPNLQDSAHEDPFRIPSPPPLPADWDLAPDNPAPGGGLLFDFDQFDQERPREETAAAEPLMTVTSAMNPSEVSNPSDDYIWQILFAGENDNIPKRVTAHLHHPVGSPGDFLDFDHPLPEFAHTDTKPAIDVGHDTIPPPPAEVWDMLGEQKEAKTVTVTYVLSDGGQYAVKKVKPDG